MKLAFLHKPFFPSKHNSYRPHFFRHHTISLYTLILLLSHLHFGIISYSPVAVQPEKVKNEVYTLTNSERTKTGLGGLKESKKLNFAAQKKLDDMFNKDYWDHRAPDGTQAWSFIEAQEYNYVIAGENLAKGFSSAGPMTEAWMNSPTHRANITNEKYTETGIAVGNGFINGKYSTVAVQLFAKPSQYPTDQKTLVAGEKMATPSLSLEAPIQSDRIGMLLIYLILLMLLVVDGLIIRARRHHHDRKTKIAFRLSVAFNALVFITLLVNIGTVF